MPILAAKELTGNPMAMAIPTIRIIWWIPTAAAAACLLLSGCAATYSFNSGTTAGAVSDRAATDGAVPVPAPFHSVEEVVAELQKLEGWFRSRGDHRAVFVTAYLEISRTLLKWLHDDRFASEELVERYVVAFANEYRLALEEYEARAPLPEAWRLAFAVAESGTDNISEDLLLGINAHINRDLPFAILGSGLDVHCELCLQDHLRINDALREATPRVRRSIVACYGRDLAMISALFGRRIDRGTISAFVEARNHAWAAAQAMDRARSPSARRAAGAEIEARAARSAQGIIADCRSPERGLAVLRLTHGAATSLIRAGEPGRGERVWRCVHHRASELAHDGRRPSAADALLSRTR